MSVEKYNRLIELLLNRKRREKLYFIKKGEYTVNLNE